MRILRFLSEAAWSNGFWWGFKLGRLAVETRLRWEYKKLGHAPRRTRMAARGAILEINPAHDVADYGNDL